jgi:hypothetical protein
VHGQFIVFLTVAGKGFLLPAFDGTRKFIAQPLFLTRSLYHKEVGFMVYVLRIDGIGVAFTKCHVMDGIQHIGFTLTVLADKAIQTGRKRQLCFFDVLEIENGKTLDLHGDA